MRLKPLSELLFLGPLKRFSTHVMGPVVHSMTARFVQRKDPLYGDDFLEDCLRLPDGNEIELVTLELCQAMTVIGIPSAPALSLAPREHSLV